MTICDDDIFVKTKPKKKTIWNNPSYATKAGVVSSVLSLRMKANQAKNRDGTKMFSNEDMVVIERVILKMKEICLNCIE